MQPVITCKNCGNRISIDEALLHDIKEEARKEANKDYDKQIQIVKEEAKREAEVEAEKRLKEADSKGFERAKQKFEEGMKDAQEETDEEREENKELREQLKLSTKELREIRRSSENAELEMQKKFTIEEKRIREEAEKSANEKQRLVIDEYKKKLSDTEKSLAEAQRKANQGSMQTQGEVMELDLEQTLSAVFTDDEISPVAKGVKGADIQQTVRSPRGNICGVILWETKRTKNWSDGWIEKLKEDCRTAKANVPVLITEVMPSDAKQDIALYNGIWVAKPGFAVPLATLLRKNLLDVERQRALVEDRGTKADSLYSFVTSHEFAQQIESMVETYIDMREQIVKERVVYERSWAMREKQAQKLLTGTANIIGAMQGQIGHTAMPKIKGLELMELPEAPDEDSL
ncbi:MAG: DUF2130 domain-containing protein [Patescibacteria group bacterium]